jgi:flagellar assembly factor FliW
MNVLTSRFGTVEIEEADIIDFEDGLIGFDDRKRWVILADSENEAIAWLQSLEDPNLAMAVVSPRRFVPHYQVKIPTEPLKQMGLTDSEQAFVLTVVSRHDHGLTVNLRAPLIIVLERRAGWQIITEDDQPLQYTLDQTASKELRKSA